MKILPTPLEGAAEIQCFPIRDHRGWFARYFCQKELSELNGGREIQQINSSLTIKRGAIRGLHFQNPPYAEDKIVRCIAGRIFDVIVDIRKGSPTFGHWHSVTLDAEEMNMVYIPKGFVHGFQTLDDNCQILYLHTEFHNHESEGGFRFDSPMLAIPWPIEITDISERDRNLNYLEPSFEGIEI